jgi:hypothetical protein
MAEEKEKEIWKSLDFMGYPDYEVSNFGRVKSLPRNTTKGKILKQGKQKNGYLTVMLYKDGKGKTFTVHRLVCLTFLENPLNLPQINHKDENKENNKVENLEWCTCKYNITYNNIHIKKILKISESMKGKTHSEETKKKISKTLKGKYIGEKSYWYGKHHIERQKPILQFTKDGEFIRDWDSIIQVSKELNINSSHICSCCKGRKKSAYGFIWRYK